MLIALVKSSFGVFTKDVYTKEEFLAMTADRKPTMYWAMLFDQSGKVLDRAEGDLKNV